MSIATPICVQSNYPIDVAGMPNDQRESWKSKMAAFEVLIS